MSDLKLKKIRPINSQILLTANMYEEEGHLEGSDTIIAQSKIKGSCKLWQKVISAGPLCRYVKDGDTVMIDPFKYIKVEHPEDKDSIRGIVTVRNDYTRYSLPTILVDNKKYLLLNEQDVAFIIDEYEEV